MIPHNPLQELHNLDKTSTQFHAKLSNFIRGDVYQSALPSLQSENLTWLIEYLDSILFGVSDHKGPVFQEFLHELRKVCGIKEVLPKSCTLPESLLGCAYEGTFNGSKVRIRRVRVCSGRETREAKEIFRQVVVTSKHLEHPNIVPLLGVTMEPLELVSDWMPGGDLLGYIAERPDAYKPSLLSDVAEGLHHLHSCDVIHGDLKSSNVLVDVTGHARLTDFGLALVTRYPGSIGSTFFEHGQSARWIAPEILGGQGTYSKEADVFSFAGVAIEVFTGATPFNDRPPHAARFAVMGGERPPRPTHPTLTDRLWTLIQHCWIENPHLRPHALRISCVFGDPAWKRLINSPLPLDGQISLIAEALSDRDEIEMVKGLSGDEAQSFADVVDKVLDSLGPPLRQKCLSVLCKICGRQALLPRSLRIPVCYDRSDDPLYTGGFADVWMGEYQGTKVAVKVLRVSESSDFDKITSRFCKEVMTWRSLRHPNVLPLLGVTMSSRRFAMISEWMGHGNIKEFIEEHRGVNRFELLKDVAGGLIYMHDQAMVHGDLKGANILIDETCHARLADFGLLTFVSDPANPTASISTTNFGGTTRWMSPELFHPELFGLEDSRLTKESDCYALGMVIFEVLSGRAPFACHKEYVVMRKVVDGERPERPKEVWFTDDIWRTIEQCWLPQPGSRPTVAAVFECLERVSLATTIDCQQRLITGSFSHGELPFLLQVVFWNREPTDIIQCLQGGDAQALVDTLNEAFDHPNLPSDVQNRCMGSLHEICAHYALFPSSLKIELCDDPTDVVLHHGEFGDVSKRNYQGGEVAVKTLKTCTASDLQAIICRFCKEYVAWRALRHPNILPLMGVVATDTEFAMVSEWMTNGDINQFVEGHQDVNRFELLSDVAKGLTYLHNQGVIHGDLRGGNILVDQTRRARLAVFGLLTVISDSTISNPYTRKDIIRLTSPELLDPEVQDHRPTKYSDCYGLGMVIYQVLSRRVPFYGYEDLAIFEKVMRGDRPERPEGMEGVWLTGGIWEVLERCWVLTPQNRSSVNDVLLCLEETSKCWIPPSPDPPLAATSATDSLARRLSDQNTTVRIDARGMNPVEALLRLGNSSPQFSERLSRVLSGPDFDESIRGLGEKPLMLVTENLDKALDRLPPASVVFKQTHSAIEKVLRVRGKYEVFPSSCLIPSGKLLDRVELPVVGCSATVCQAKFNGRKVCIKILGRYPHGTGSIVHENFYTALVLWRRLQHPNIVPILGVTTETPPPFEIVCDWMDNGSITEYMGEHPQVDCIDLLRDMADGLHYLHSCGIVHGDLKAANILIDKDGRARLTDFGLTSIIGGNKSDTPQGPNPVVAMTWTVAGILNGGTVTNEVDVFVFAMVVAETFTRHSIRKQQADILGTPARNPPERRKEMLSPDELWKLLQRCWNPDPTKRPTASEISDFFRSLYTREREAQKSPPPSPEAYTVISDRDEGVSEPLPDPPIEDSRKSDQKRRLGIGINRRGPMMGNRRSVTSQGRERVTGARESSTDPAAQAPLQNGREGSPGEAMRKRLRTIVEKSTL